MAKPIRTDNQIAGIFRQAEKLRFNYIEATLHFNIPVDLIHRS